MKQLAILSLLVFILLSCHSKTIKPVPKGEFAFLLQYNGRNPADVGFLTNHVVERRVANLLKDSFEVFMSKTAYAMPIYVDTANWQVVGAFYSDSILKNASAYILIDVKQDALWVAYRNGDSTIRFADNPSLKKPTVLSN